MNLCDDISLNHKMDTIQAAFLLENLERINQVIAKRNEIGRDVPDQPDELFLKIINREIDANIIHEDDHCIAFMDVNPIAPFHALIIPRKPLRMLSDAELKDKSLLGHLFLTANELALKNDLICF